MNRSSYPAFILAILLSVTTSATGQRKDFNIYDRGGIPRSLQQTLVERLKLYAEYQRTGNWDKVAEMLGELSNGVSRSKYTAEQKQWVIERLKEKPLMRLIPTGVSFSTANLNRSLGQRWWYVEGEGEFLPSEGPKKVVILCYRDRGEWYFQPMVVTSNSWTPLLKPAPRVPGSTESVPCSQSTASREALIERAEKLRFTVRRVEFVGSTYTRDQVIRQRMTDFQEGDLFSRQKLLNSLRNMSELRNEIHPVILKNVELRLNEPEQTVDMTICFKPKRR